MAFVALTGKCSSLLFCLSAADMLLWLGSLSLFSLLIILAARYVIQSAVHQTSPDLSSSVLPVLAPSYQAG